MPEFVYLRKCAGSSTRLVDPPSTTAGDTNMANGLQYYLPPCQIILALPFSVSYGFFHNEFLPLIMAKL